MKIKLNLNIFLFLILFFITNQIDVYALVMVFALIHELAHLICGVILGFKPGAFKIMPLGFSIEFETNVQDYNKKIIKSNILSVKNILIALAGPFINLIIVIMGLIFSIDTNIIYANFLILIFNLLPIYPLDGGRILINILKIFYGNRKANKYTNTIRNIFIILLTISCSILILFVNNIAIVAILGALWCMTIKENIRYNTYNKIYETIDKTYNYL